MKPEAGAARDIVLYLSGRKLVAIEGLALEGEPQVLRHITLKNPDGFHGSFISNLEQAAGTIESALNQLSPGWDERENRIYVVLGHPKIKTYSYTSSSYFQGVQRPVTAQDVRHVVEQTRSVATLPLNEYVLQAIPESFLVNDMPDVKNPIGLEATRLGVSLKMFTVPYQDFKNTSKAFETAEIEPSGYFPKMLTVSDAVLLDEEKKQGVLLLDVSEEGLNLILWKNGYLVDSKTIHLGEQCLTSQIAAAWGIDALDALKVKEQYASLEPDTAGDELIPLVERHGKNTHPIRRQAFQEKLFVQAEAWLGRILNEAKTFCADHKAAFPYYVFTGEGIALNGFLEFLQKKFNQEGRLGLSRKMEAPHELLVDPSMTAALGMLTWLSANLPVQEQFFAPRGFFQKTFASARDWLSSYF